MVFPVALVGNEMNIDLALPRPSVPNLKHARGIIVKDIYLMTFAFIHFRVSPSIKNLDLDNNVHTLAPCKLDTISMRIK